MPITFFINVSIQKTNINILVPLCDAQYTKTKDIIVKGLIYNWLTKYHQCVHYTEITTNCYILSTSASSASKIAFVKIALIIVRVCISTQIHNSNINNTETTIEDLPCLFHPQQKHSFTSVCPLPYMRHLWRATKPDLAEYLVSINRENYCLSRWCSKQCPIMSVK